MRLVNWWMRRRRYATRWQRRWVQILSFSRCEYCHRFVANDDAVIDHITPFSRGGWSSIFNFAYSCRSCNNAKGARTPAEWKPVTLRHFRRGVPS